MKYIFTNAQLREAINDTVAQVNRTVNPKLKDRLQSHLNELLEIEKQRAATFQLEDHK